MNGVLLINKPKGITSHDVVFKVRKALKMKAVGHAGTLDPLAEGVLVVLLGEATKLSNYLTGMDKTYTAEIHFGVQTDSWDTDGQLIEGHVLPENLKIDFTEEQIKNEISKLVGDLEIKVPLYSAIKIKGKKLYEYAREGKEIETPKRTMKFYSADFVSFEPSKIKQQGFEFKTQKLVVKLKCEKGAYIRSWINTLGENLACGAVMSGLTRESSGDFNLKDSLHLDDLVNRSLNGPVTAINLQELKPLEFCFKTPFFRVSETQIKLIRNGQIPHDLQLRLVPLVKEAIADEKDFIIRVLSSKDQSLAALLQIEASGRSKILRALQN